MIIITYIQYSLKVRIIKKPLKSIGRRDAIITLRLACGVITAARRRRRHTRGSVGRTVFSSARFIGWAHAASVSPCSPTARRTDPRTSCLPRAGRPSPGDPGTSGSSPRLFVGSLAATCGEKQKKNNNNNNLSIFHIDIITNFRNASVDPCATVFGCNDTHVLSDRYAPPSPLDAAISLRTRDPRWCSDDRRGRTDTSENGSTSLSLFVQKGQCLTV